MRELAYSGCNGAHILRCMRTSPQIRPLPTCSVLVDHIPCLHHKVLHHAREGASHVPQRPPTHVHTLAERQEVLNRLHSKRAAGQCQEPPCAPPADSCTREAQPMQGGKTSQLAALSRVDHTAGDPPHPTPCRASPWVRAALWCHPSCSGTAQARYAQL